VRRYHTKINYHHAHQTDYHLELSFVQTAARDPTVLSWNE
jgi:hypothetical protein